MKFWIGFIVLAITMFFSCSENAEPTPVTVIDGKLLINNDGWIVISSVQDDGTSKKDLFADYIPCVADNIYKFTSDKLYVIDEGQHKCKIADAQTKESGSWKLNSSSLVMRPAGDVPYQFTISSLTSDKLVFTYLEMGTNGIVKSITTITFQPASSI